MSITLQKYNEDSIGNDVDNSNNNVANHTSTVIITSFSSTEGGATYTASDGTIKTVIIKGSFDVSAFKTPPKTLADALASNASLLMSSFTEYDNNGVIDETVSSSSPISLSTFINKSTSLANLNSYYSGNDGFYSSTNNKKSGSSDTVYGYGGNDTYYENHLLTTYNDLFYGGAGTDKIILPSKYVNYTIKAGQVWDHINQKTGLSGFTITDNTKTYNTVQINLVERVQFSDGTLALGFTKAYPVYQSAMMIGAAFGQSYINSYFAAALSLYEQGQTDLQVATLIVNAGLIESQIGSTSNTAYVDFIYKNVTGVAPDKLTEAVFVNDLNTGVYTKVSLLALAAGVSNLEQQIGLTGLQQTGLFYHPVI